MPNPAFAEIGGGGLIGLVNYLSGNMLKQRFDNFVNNELPQIATNIHNATTSEDVQKHAMDFFTKGLKAGLKPEQLDKLSAHLIQPALNNLGAGEIDKIGREIQGGQVQNTPPPRNDLSQFGGTED